jgi:hypothetical protein
MVRIDERQEAIAFIRMTIDNAAAQKASHLKDHTYDSDPQPDLDNIEHPEPIIDDSPVTDYTWKFGSPEGKRTNSRTLEANFAPLNHDYDLFDQRLRKFIADSLPEEALRHEDEVYVSLLWYGLNSN